MFSRELGKRHAPGYSRGRLLQRKCVLGALGAWILKFELVSASPGGLVETDCWDHVLISALAGGGAARGDACPVMLVLWSSNTLGESRLRERSASWKTGAPGRDKKQKYLATFLDSAVHTLILLNHALFTLSICSKSPLFLLF